MIKQNVLIRCDASTAIGLGHITRCLVLANEFRDAGHKVIFAMKNHMLGIEKAIENNFEVLVASDDKFDYDKWIQKIANDKNINIFIGDVRDGLPIETINKLKEKKILTVAIDEPSEYRKACDLCFYPPVPQVDELDWNGFKGEIYKGWEYVILRPEFYKDYKKVKNVIPNILVMMGGTDPYNLTLEVVKQLLSLEEEINISVVIKKDHLDYNAIKALGNNINVYSEIVNIAEFLTKIDFGIISFGVSAYELLAMQIPAIHICLDEDHWKASEIFENEKLAKRYKRDNFNFKNNHFHFKIKALERVRKNKVINKILKRVK